MSEIMKHFNVVAEALYESARKVESLKAENNRLRQAIAEAEKQEPVVKIETRTALLRCPRCGNADKLRVDIEYAHPQPQPKAEQGEPVAYRYWNEHNKCFFFCDSPEPVDGSVYEPLYTHPQPRKQLTDELEGQLLADKTYLRGMKAGYNLAMMNDGKNFNAAIAAYEKQIIEAAHGIKEKNT